MNDLVNESAVAARHRKLNHACRRWSLAAIAAVILAAQPLTASAGECLVRPGTEPSTGAARAEGVIFQTDFSDDTGYSVKGSASLWNGGSGWPVAPPKGWDGIRAGGQTSIEVVSGEGIGGTNALKLAWAPNGTQPTASLGKHLTGDEKTGYDELYIRYRVRLPNQIKLGDDGKLLTYWKWGRLWQNTSPDNSSPNKWTENRANSGFVMWAFSNNVPYTSAVATWSENSGSKLQYGSAGGERHRIDYYVPGSDQHTAPGYFESLWDINMSDRPGTLQNNTSQSWHTLEYRFKLASYDGADDGIYEMWWDGAYQGDFTRIRPSGGAPQRSGIPTTRRGSGFNFFVFFDNLAGFNSDWSDPGVDGHILVNDVVVSTSPIGPNYEPGN